MTYNAKEQKGSRDKSFTPIKVAFSKNSSHDQVLTKCVSHTWKQDSVPGLIDQFYLSDGSGSAIPNENFEIDLEDGTKETVQWTLQNYFKVSGVRYPSRTRLYCVKVPSGEMNINVISGIHKLFDCANNK